MLGDLLEFLFVPSEERITALTNTVSSKFGFVETIKTAISSLQNVINNIGAVPSIDINLGSTQYTSATTVSFNLSWYAQFKPFGDLVITGFCYAAFIWRMFIKLPGIISGSAGNIEVSDTGINIVSKRGGNK